jgi:hypothetical protein
VNRRKAPRKEGRLKAGGFVEHCLEGAVDLDSLRSGLHALIIASEEGQTSVEHALGRPLVKPTSAWNKMGDDLAVAFRKHGLKYSISAKVAEKWASPALRTAIELHSLFPSDHQRHNVDLGGWRDRFHPSVKKK